MGERIERWFSRVLCTLRDHSYGFHFVPLEKGIYWSCKHCGSTWYDRIWK